MKYLKIIISLSLFCTQLSAEASKCFLSDMGAGVWMLLKVEMLPNGRTINVALGPMTSKEAALRNARAAKRLNVCEFDLKPCKIKHTFDGRMAVLTQDDRSVVALELNNLDEVEQAMIQAEKEMLCTVPF